MLPRPESKDLNFMKKVSSCIYGPVNSWRMGKSLGVDLLRVDSICSFDCVYCQLGRINRLTDERSIFVPTAEVIRELKKSNWRDADVITFSGSGEPTLAANLGAAIHAVKKLTRKPVAILTNSSLLYLAEVRAELANADVVFCKLDAWTNEDFRRANRPHPNIRLQEIVQGIKLFRDEFAGKLAVQTMILKSQGAESLRKLAAILREVCPDEVQLNLPLRPVPKNFAIDNRGNNAAFDKQNKKLKTIEIEELTKICETLFDLTNLPMTMPLLNQ